VHYAARQASQVSNIALPWVGALGKKAEVVLERDNCTVSVWRWSGVEGHLVQTYQYQPTYTLLRAASQRTSH
jgi:hypothetical protein